MGLYGGLGCGSELYLRLLLGTPGTLFCAGILDRDRWWWDSPPVGFAAGLSFLSFWLAVVETIIDNNDDDEIG